MKKLLTSLCVCTLALLCLLVLPTTAEAAVEGNYTYGISNGKAIITKYNGYGSDVTIPATLGGYPVTTIDLWAFRYCTNLTSVAIGGNVTTVFSEAFSNCTNLTTVTMGDSVTAIGDDAFAGCASLTSVTIGNGITYIGDSAFSDCNSLRYNIYDNATYLGNASNPYVALIKVTSTSISKCKIHENTKIIAESAFSSCRNLTNVKIPDSVVVINSGAFENCTDICFSVTIGNNVTTIDSYAFSGCTWLTSITIPDGVTTIGSYAFSGCSRLTSITISDSVTAIGEHAFSNCNGLQYNTHGNAKYLGNPFNPYFALIEATSTDIEECAIHGDAKIIAESAFYRCYSLTSLTIGNSVTTIGDYAFYNCDSLPSVTIPDSVISIGDYAFQYCSRLTSISIPDGVTTIGSCAFFGCTRLTSITIPDSVTAIDWGTFRYCHALQYVILPENMESIDKGAFENCYELKHVLFKGDQDQLGCIQIEADNNKLKSATWHIDATGNEITKVQTCDRLTVYCAVCQSYIVKETTSLKHVFEEKNYVSNNDAICLTDGTETCKCTYCEVTATRTDEDSKLGHSFTNYVSDGNATCTGDGTETAICDRCDETDSRTEGGSALGHTFTNYVSNGNAICLVDGTETAKCDRCEETATQTEVGSALGHSFTNYVSNGNATCNADGTKTAKCDRCVATDTVVDIGSSGHKFTNYVSNGNATCYADGTKTAVCDYCPQVDTVVDYGSAGNHNFKKYISDNNATCTEDGTKTAKCAYCDVTDTVTDTGSKLGHWYENNKCTRCGIMPVKITKQPTSVTVANGQQARVTVTATGDGLIYRWYVKNPGDSKYSYTSGFSGNSYYVTMNATRNGRRVMCIVYDKYGNKVESASAALNMKQTVKITKQPTSVTVANGAQAKVTVTATGDGLTYRWYYKNAGDSSYTYTSSFNGNSYYVTMNSERNGRSVLCRVYDKYGNVVQTTSAKLSMKQTVKITKQPTSVTVVNGVQAKVTVTATGDGLIYRWYVKNPGATKYTYTDSFSGNSYYVTMNAARNGRRVLCIVYDKYGNKVESQSVVLKMK